VGLEEGFGKSACCCSGDEEGFQLKNQENKEEGGVCSCGGPCGDGYGCGKFEKLKKQE